MQTHLGSQESWQKFKMGIVKGGLGIGEAREHTESENQVVAWHV